MKMITILLAALSCSVLSSSCYTHYTCNCSAVDTANHTTVQYHQEFKGGQSNAQGACSSKRAEYSSDGYTNVTCAVPI